MSRRLSAHPFGADPKVGATALVRLHEQEDEDEEDEDEDGEDDEKDDEEDDEGEGYSV